jgi:exodeoxyribonuclease V alpha subunit
VDQVFGFIERITFLNPENGFTVAKLQEPKKKELTTLVGVLPDINPGVTLCCQGTWKFSSQHGAQFEVQNYTIEAPKDLLGIQKYLQSGLIKGIGPKFAEKIVKTFGIKTLSIIDEEPFKLLNVPGIGDKKVDRIISCWSKQKSIRDVMIFLQKNDLSPTLAQRIFKSYGDKSLEILQNQPYKIAQDIMGIGFKTADLLAKKLGIELSDFTRLKAGIEHVLNELSADGHVCFPKDKLVEESQKLLNIDISKIEEALFSLIEDKRIVLEKEKVFLKYFYLAEQGIAREIARITSSLSPLRTIDTPKAVSWVEEELSIKLADNQKDAVSKALKEKFLIITGGPGTGKSTITKAILKISEKLTSKIVLAAPTGRASKRMSEITRKESKTIHSLLEWSFSSGGFKRNREFPLDANLVIIDESSMIDTILMYQLLKAIPSNARVIFLGDIHQLPSVGAGNVLKDMIESLRLTTITLNEIFRQAKGSKIITNAHKINEGTYPDTSNHPKGDFFFLKHESPEEITKTIIELVTVRLPRLGYESDKDIQILTPMKKGSLGTEALNFHLQNSLRNTSNPLFSQGKRFFLHDKVMQIKNNYDKEVFNGDIGIIVGIDTSEQEVIVSYEGRKIIYDFTELDEITSAYAVSVHKYQGSECPCIIMPIHTSHFILLHRNLLYTAVTRGKKLVILIGTPKALHIAINTNDTKERFSALKDAIETTCQTIF